MELVPFKGFINTKSILIALVPSQESARLIYQRFKGTPAEKLHLTITILESINAKSYQDVKSFCSDLAQHKNAFIAKVNDLEQFSSSRERSGTGDPVVLTMLGDEFANIRRDLSPLLLLHQEDYDMKRYDFNPHITVGYLPKNNNVFHYEEPGLDDIVFDRILVSNNGKETYYTFQ